MEPADLGSPENPRAYLVHAQERLTHARNYLNWQARLVMPELGQRIVEVGCGIGTFTRALLDRDAVLALDIDPESVERVKQQYREHSNLQAFVCDAGGDNIRKFAGFRADSCVCLNVLEHVEDDLHALRGMASILAPGGVIVMLVPAFQALYGPIDRNLGHYRRYRSGTVAALAQAAELRVRKMHYLNVAGFFAWWASSRIFKPQFHSEQQIELYDRLMVPLMSRLEQVVRPPFGQSLFVVLEKQ